MSPSRRKLRQNAAELAAPLPPLLAAAHQLAQTVLPGDHGRRRAGQGDEFWQYRPAVDTDSQQVIDWRRSARSDGRFVRQKEWKLAQSVMFWVDGGASMLWAGAPERPVKAERAALLCLAAVLLLNRAGERFGLCRTAGEAPLQPRSGKAQVMRLAGELSGVLSGVLSDKEEGTEARIRDFSHPDPGSFRPDHQMVFMSDFLGPEAEIMPPLERAANQRGAGIILQVLDPAEDQFPYAGRTIFESPTGALQHETLTAADLRNRYLDRLATRKALLADFAAHAGWHYSCHLSDAPAAQALLWMYQALQRHAR